MFFMMYFTTASCNRQEATECDLQSYSKTTSMTASHISCRKITCFKIFFLCSTPATLTLSGVINLVLVFFFFLVSFLWVNSEVFKSITHYQDIELEVEFQTSQLHRLSCETNAEYWFLLSISLLLFWWWLKVIFYWKKLKRLQIELFR